MARKTKFKPEIRRIKLNPEQAVLNCACFMNMTQFGSGGPHAHTQPDHTTGGVDFVAGFCTAARTAHRQMFRLGSSLTTSAETNSS